MELIQGIIDLGEINFLQKTTKITYVSKFVSFLLY